MALDVVYKIFSFNPEREVSKASFIDEGISI